MYGPRFEISKELLWLVAEAAELRAWIRGAVVGVSWLPALQRDSAARLAHSSTAIEGNPLSLADAEALARGEDIAAASSDKREVLNYLAAARWIASGKAPVRITEKDLLRLHRQLTRGVLPGEACGAYKRKPNRVVDAKGRTVYTPPPPDKARALTRALLDWLNAPATLDLHPIVTSAIAHHRLVSIHPFFDGNGRLARAVAMWILAARGFDTEHLFALDEFFEKDRQLYYDKVQQARDLDDVLTYWLDYVARGVVETLKATRTRIESLRVAHASTKLVLTRRQEDVLRLLRDRGRLRSPDIEKAFGVTRARVAQILKPLTDAGLVVREGQTRATMYRLP